LGEVFWIQSSSPWEVEGLEAHVEGGMDGVEEKDGVLHTGTDALGSDCCRKSALLAVGGSLSFDYYMSLVQVQCKRKTDSDC